MNLKTAFLQQKYLKASPYDGVNFTLSSVLSALFPLIVGLPHSKWISKLHCAAQRRARAALTLPTRSSGVNRTPTPTMSEMGMRAGSRPQDLLPESVSSDF